MISVGCFYIPLPQEPIKKPIVKEECKHNYIKLLSFGYYCMDCRKEMTEKQLKKYKRNIRENREIE